ncbi:UDP-N-acetylglucosamine 4,6-dehydratase [Desulfurella amilsii]|uniref:UDP-N-acetylglucosamine 4,6-dehydratase n=1 Tax=Desulfurella amilsii TaxID=1562698 RepID=A0A1X4XVX4_9BACT|nr:UDP-N-acetylglucosamine 4,6-dehydratase (inverting) [Desulfurella amilsii]OSS41692.1 UDP-N-acetylglucosamine 4,6-dehydratase [Desulfurella amilsii]
MLNDKTILITGGTGSFGKAFTKAILKSYKPKKLIIYSRDEYKQFVMQKEFSRFESTLRFFIGDVRDKDRLYRALDSVDIVIHAAALKQVPIAEYNPLEAIKTNVYGAENVIDASIDCSVEKVVALSSDKAVNPVNLYGATKLVSDKLFIAGNSYVGKRKTKFCVVRYGNVAASRGSVIPFFKNLVDSGKKELPITDFEMTRFWISLEEGVELVFSAIREATGGEIYVSKIPSFKIVDLAKAMCEDCTLKEIGIREGEKLHEVMITPEDARNTYEYDDHFIIYPQFKWWGNSNIKSGGKLVKKGFRYSSDTNDKWLSIENIKNKLKSLNIEY